MPESTPTACPHCAARLVRIALNDTVYDHEWDLACFNDECPYYVRGWVWMEQQFGVRSSYRYRFDARYVQPSPLPS